MVEAELCAVVFVGSPADDRAAARLVRALEGRVAVEVVDRRSSELQSLLLVAKHGVVEAPTTLVCLDGAVLVRVLEVPTPAWILSVLRVVAPAQLGGCATAAHQVQNR